MQLTSGSKGKSPSQGSVWLLLRSEDAYKILIVERSDDECVIGKTGLHDNPINLGLTGEGSHLELAAADRFHIRQCRPDEVLRPSIQGRAYGRGRLLTLVGVLFPEVGNQKHTVCRPEPGGKCLRPIEIGFDDFVAEAGMLFADAKRVQTHLIGVLDLLDQIARTLLWAHRATAVVERGGEAVNADLPPRIVRCAMIAPIMTTIRISAA
jgi:hypothetical protein